MPGKLLRSFVAIIPKKLRDPVKRILRPSDELTAQYEILDKQVTLIYGEPRPFSTHVLGEASLRTVRDAFNHVPRTTLLPPSQDAHPEWLLSDLDSRSIRQLNESIEFLDCQELGNAVAALLESEGSFILDALNGSPFRVVNVRAWTTRPNAPSIGPNAYHLDGFHAGFLKAMIYLDGLGGSAGSLEIEGNGLVTGPPGLMVIFENSKVWHRAVPGTRSERPVMELTLQRLVVPPMSQIPLVGSPMCRYPRDPLRAYS
mgnify:CR=1 FL=1